MSYKGTLPCDKLLSFNHVFAVYKPSGPSSSSVVEMIKKSLIKRFYPDAPKSFLKSVNKKFKVGHGGTLDPLASGILVIGINHGCKKMDEYLRGPKEYIANALFGVHYDTLDVTGRLISEDFNLKMIEESLLNQACLKWTGNIMQKPPSFSAIRVNGERAYKLARDKAQALQNLNSEGSKELLDLPPRPVIVYSIQIIKIEGKKVFFSFKVGGGTYVRSLIRDIAASMGTVATMETLERTVQGDFTLDKTSEISESIDTLEKLILDQQKYT